MTLEKINVSKERKTAKDVIRVNDATKGRISRTTVTKRNEIKKNRNKCNKR